VSNSLWSDRSLLQIYAVSITIRIVVSTNMSMNVSSVTNLLETSVLIMSFYLFFLWQFGFMFIALIWKFDFAPFMVLIIAILNDGEISSKPPRKFISFSFHKLP